MSSPRSTGVLLTARLSRVFSDAVTGHVMDVDAETVDRVVGCVHQGVQRIGQREPDLLHPPAQAVQVVLHRIQSLAELLRLLLRHVAAVHGQRFCAARFVP